MELGKGIKESTAERLVDKVKPDLLAGEAVALVCKCNNFKPLVDRILLTNVRLLAASASDGKVKFSARRDEVGDVVVDSGWSGSTIGIVLRDGTSSVFKSVDEADAQTIRARLSLEASASSADPPVEQAADQPGVGARLKKAYTDAQTARAELAEANEATYGALVKKGQFGLKTVEIYASGYVRVGAFLSQGSPFEKLKSIKFSFQVQDRSGVGHLWTSGGLGSKEKRVLFLTIATDKKIHTLSTEGEMGRREDNLAMALEAAGNSVLADAQSAPRPTNVTQAASEATVGERLRQIAELHQDGVLSDDEFAAAKAKLLDQL